MDFFREIVGYVSDTIFGWSIILGGFYLLIVLGRLNERNADVQKEVKDLKERIAWQQSDIEKLKQSVEKLGAPIPRGKIPIY